MRKLHEIIETSLRALMKSKNPKLANSIIFRLTKVIAVAKELRVDKEEAFLKGLMNVILMLDDEVLEEVHKDVYAELGDIYTHLASLLPRAQPTMASTFSIGGSGVLFRVYQSMEGSVIDMSMVVPDGFSAEQEVETPSTSL